MGRGCCVVASDTGGFKELIQEGEDGFLFDQGNVQELVRKLEYIFEHIQFVNEIGRKAQFKVISEYS